MTKRISPKDWLTPVSADREAAWQEYLLNWALVALALTALVYALLSLVAWALGKAPLLGALSGFAVLPFYGLAYLLGRRGRIRLAAYIPTIALFLVMVAAQYQVGVGHSTVVGLVMATVTAGLLLGAWLAVALAVLSTVAYATLGLAQQAGSLPAPLPPEQTVIVDGVALGVGLLALVILVWLSKREMDRAVALARESERQIEDYTRELEGIQGQLERQVEERTKDLGGFTQQLQASLQEQQELWETVQRLSIPILPVHEGVLVMPLIGHIDATRAERLVDDLLIAIEEQSARVVILDVTGVPVMDSQVANSVIQTARAARLLGAETVLVGVRPDVADTLARLAVDGAEGLGEVLGGMVTQRDLQEGVRYALARTREASLAGPRKPELARRRA
jgi:rsbT co-antagonist protein RsbR